MVIQEQAQQLAVLNNNIIEYLTHHLGNMFHNKLKILKMYSLIIYHNLKLDMISLLKIVLNLLKLSN